MKKLSKLSLACFLLVLLIGCTGKNQSSELKEAEPVDEILYIDLENITKLEEAVSLSTEASDILYIPLETKDNSLIERVSNVFPWNDNYLISVRPAEKLFWFDQSGKFIQKISQQGGGPADYIRIDNIIPDPATGSFYLITFTHKKMIKFDKEAKYVAHYPMADMATTGIMTPRGTLLHYLHNKSRYEEDTTAINSLMETDTLGHVIQYYKNQNPRYRKEGAIPLTIGVRPLYVHNSQVRFNEFGSDTLYTVVQDSIIPYAVLHLGDMKMDHNPVTTTYTPQIETNRELQALSSKLYIDKIYENEHTLYISLLYGIINDDHLNCLYSKKTKKLVRIKDNLLSNDIDGGIDFFPKRIEENGDMITWINAEEFKEEILSKDYNAQKAKYGERFEKVYQLARSLEEDDNPVLIIAKGK